jgi:hypothetical protein
MDTSTVLVVFLLVTAATLASYALSHWSWLRGTIGSFGWAATSIGTTMLLTAAAIVVLTFVFRGPLWRPNFATEQQLRETATAANERPARQRTASAVPIESENSSGATASQAERAAGNRDEDAGSVASTSNNERLQMPTSARSAEQNKSGRSEGSLPVFADSDPWAATRCVHVLNPDLGEPTRWKVENDCDVPVGVIVTVCAGSARRCVDQPMIFPTKMQRPIPLAEQTVYGDEVRHVACFAGTASAIYLLGAPSEERSTSEWHEQFTTLRQTDGCLSRLQMDGMPGASTQLTERARQPPRP